MVRKNDTQSVMLSLFRRRRVYVEHPFALSIANFLSTFSPVLSSQ